MHAKNKPSLSLRRKITVSVLCHLQIVRTVNMKGSSRNRQRSLSQKDPVLISSAFAEEINHLRMCYLQA